MRSARRYQLRRPYPDASVDQLKREAEVVIATVLVLITSPLMLLIALAIKWEGPGPIFERHIRIGRDGRRFQMLSFRTTAPDPEHRMPVCARQSTQIGECLRYTRIECLPRIFNVLRGEMSLRETCVD